MGDEQKASDGVAVEAKKDAASASDNAVNEIEAAAPEPVPSPSPAPQTSTDAMDGLRKTVENLSETVTSLSDLVQSTLIRDKPATKVPWTHRGSRDHGDDSS